VSLSGISKAGFVTIQAYDVLHSPVITSMATTGATGFIFSGVEFNCDGNGDAFYGFRIYSSANIRFVGCDFHAALDGNPPNKTQTGFLVDTSSNILFNTGCKFHELNGGAVFQNSTGWNVTGNIFYEISGDGIDFTGGSNYAIANNTFTNFFPTPGSHPDAIQGFTQGSTSAAMGGIITGNTITRGIGYPMQGVFITDDSGVKPFTNLTVSNNNMLGTLANAILISGGSNVAVQNNIANYYTNEPAPGGYLQTQMVMVNISTLNYTNNQAFYFRAPSGCSNVTNSGNVSIAGSGPAPTPATLPLPH
jgi:hypothetical protein